MLYRVSCVVPSLLHELLAKSLSSQVGNARTSGFVSVVHFFYLSLAGLGAFELRSARPPVWPSLLTIFSLFVSNSTKRWLGTVRCAARGCCLARGFGRRSYPLFLSSSPRLLILVSSFSNPCSFDSTAGVRGTITRYVITIPTPSTTYHFYELDVATLDQDWLERHERRREWVDYAEAVRRLEWKAELAQGLRSSSLAPRK